MNLEDYYAQHIPRLRKYAEFLTEDTHEAHDLIQETFELAIRYPYNPTKGKGVYGYLIMLLKSAFLHLKDKESNRYTHMGDEVTFDDVGLQAADNPWPGIIRAIDLRERVEKMEPILREMALLLIEGYTGEEIAQQLHIPVRTANWRLERIRRALLA